jgi:hypothetical protein
MCGKKVANIWRKFNNREFNKLKPLPNIISEKKSRGVR